MLKSVVTWRESQQFMESKLFGFDIHFCLGSK